jgi:hypothetical protein
MAPINQQQSFEEVNRVVLRVGIATAGIVTGARVAIENGSLMLLSGTKAESVVIGLRVFWAVWPFLLVYPCLVDFLDSSRKASVLFALVCIVVAGTLAFRFYRDDVALESATMAVAGIPVFILLLISGAVFTMLDDGARR